MGIKQARDLASSKPACSIASWAGVIWTAVHSMIQALCLVWLHLDCQRNRMVTDTSAFYVLLSISVVALLFSVGYLVKWLRDSRKPHGMAFFSIGLITTMVVVLGCFVEGLI